MSNFVWQIYSTVKWIMLAFQWLLTTKSDGKMADISMGHDITVVSTSIWYLLQWGCTVFEIVYTAQFYKILTTVYLFGIKKSLAFVHCPFCTFKIQIQTQHFGDRLFLLRFRLPTWGNRQSPKAEWSKYILLFTFSMTNIY